MTKKVERFFAAGEPLGWRKADPQAKRRRIALRNRDGDNLATARALQYLSNVNKGPKGDPETFSRAKADANYFFRQYAKRKRKGK